MSLKDEYYEYVLKQAKVEKPKKILFNILRDMKNRRGFRQEWDCIDDEIEEEIPSTWLSFIEEEVST